MNLSLASGADPGFQVRGAHFKKLRRAEGGAKIVRVFRVENHDFTPNNHILFPILSMSSENQKDNFTRGHTLVLIITSHQFSE